MATLDEIREKLTLGFSRLDSDHLGFAVVDFGKGEVHYHEIHQGMVEHWSNFYFDLASLTKALTMGALAAKNPELFGGENRLLLEHRGGLPRWAILGKKDWSQTALKFPVKASSPLYSDLSMIRLMLNIEEKGIPLKELASFYWDQELVYWQDLPTEALCPDTGFRHRRIINGVVNDDNCFKMNRFSSHAGLFATLPGLCRSLLKLEEEVSLCDLMKKRLLEGRHERFCWGWDTVSDPDDSLAGYGASPLVFGHLGFTGTSLWIDAEKKWGWVLLTNETKKYWFNKKTLNELRKEIGQLVWQLEL